MLKKAFIILFLSVIVKSVSAQEGWFKQKISDKVTVGFPAEAKKINDQNFGIKKDDVIYLVTFVDLLKVIEMTLEDFNAEVGTQSFADTFMEGLTPSMPKYKIEKVKIFTLKGQTAYQIIGRDETNKNTTYMNIVFVDGVSYSLTCILPDGKSIKDKDFFLTNIEINK